MENPFESGHIKNYVLLYGSVVVIMVLFFIASTLFNDIEIKEKKVFETNSSISIKEDKREKSLDTNSTRFKLMNKAY